MANAGFSGGIGTENPADVARLADYYGYDPSTWAGGMLTGYGFGQGSQIPAGYIKVGNYLVNPQTGATINAATGKAARMTPEIQAQVDTAMRQYQSSNKVSGASAAQAPVASQGVAGPGAESIVAPWNEAFVKESPFTVKNVGATLLGLLSGNPLVAGAGLYGIGKNYVANQGTSVGGETQAGGAAGAGALGGMAQTDMGGNDSLSDALATGGAMGNLATKGTTTSQSTQTGGNSSVNTTSGNPTDLLTKIVTELYGQTAPHREEILSSGLDFLQGNYDYSASPMWGASKAAAEDQYGLARENLMENLPTGGSLNQGLTDIAGSRARTLTDEASKIAQDEYNKIYGYATGMPSTAIQGLGTAAGLENALSVAGIYSAASLAGQKLNAQAIEDAGKNEAMGDIGYGLASSDYGSK